jgi:hypothetical protein
MAARGSGAPSTTTTSERYAAASAAALKSCALQARAYAACATAALPEVVHGACEAEFQALKACFTREFQQLRQRR